MTEISHSFWRGHYAMWTHWEITTGCSSNSLRSAGWATGHTQVNETKQWVLCGAEQQTKKALYRGLLVSRNGRRLGLPHSRAVSSNRQSTQFQLHLPHMLWIPGGHRFTTSYVTQTFTAQAVPCSGMREQGLHSLKGFCVFCKYIT